MKELIVNIEEGWENYKAMCAKGCNKIENDDWKWSRSILAESEESLRIKNQVGHRPFGRSKQK